MDKIKPHHWITSVGRMSRRKPPKQCQPAAYYDQQAVDTLRAEVGNLRLQLDALESNRVRDNAYLLARAERAEAEADALRKELATLKFWRDNPEGMGK